MNIHVTDCLLNNDNLSHKTMKKKMCMQMINAKNQTTIFHRNRLPEKLNI